MNEEAGFLATIIATPECDTARLVYADWLEEYGGRPQRAEFIRLSVAQARAPMEWTGDLAKRRDELFLALRPDPRVDFADHRDPFFGIRALTLSEVGWKNGSFHRTDPGGCVWRGFLEAVHLRAEIWMDRAAQLRHAHPVTRVRWSDFRTDDRVRLLHLAERAGIDVAGRLFTDIAGDVWKGVRFTARQGIRVGTPSPILALLVRDRVFREMYESLTPVAQAVATAAQSFRDLSATMNRDIAAALGILPELTGSES